MKTLSWCSTSYPCILPVAAKPSPQRIKNKSTGYFRIRRFFVYGADVVETEYTFPRNSHLMKPVKPKSTLEPVIGHIKQDFWMKHTFSMVLEKASTQS
jgi:hypothetical protein